MSRIDELIAQHCSDGIEFKSLEELGSTYSGLAGKNKTDFSNGNARFVSYKNIFNNLTVDLEAGDFVRVDTGERQNSLALGDVLFTGSSETPDEVGMSSVVVDQPPEAIYLNSFCFGYRFKDDTLLLPGFSKYVFRSDAVRRQIVMSASGVTRFNISKGRFLTVRIPIPPLEVQSEIVKILDTFTQLEAELEAELEARRRQYKYYRDALVLACGEHPFRAAALNEIGEFFRGKRFTKADYEDDGIPVIHYGEIYTRYGTYTDTVVSRVRPDMADTLRYAKPGDVVITDVGETVEDVGKAVAWLGDREVAIHDHCYAFRHGMNPKFVSYCMQTTSFIAEKAKYVARTKVNTLLIDGFSKIRIPVPPLEEQERIVAILDQFDALVNDLSCGLPAEIKARRQQYAHYRDRLLTFQEAA